MPATRNDSAPRRSTRIKSTSSTAAPTKAQAKSTATATAKKAAQVAKETVKAAAAEAVSAKSALVEEVAQLTHEPVSDAWDSKLVLSEGDSVGDIALIDENDKEVKLSTLYASTGLVLFSYPRANTPGCTTQACGFRDSHEEITKLGYKIFGLSTDLPKAQMSWKKSKGLQYGLLSDPKRRLLNRLGSTAEKKRCHWVIAKGGKLLEAKIGVKPADDPSNVLKFIQSQK